MTLQCLMIMMVTMTTPSRRGQAARLLRLRELELGNCSTCVTRKLRFKLTACATVTPSRAPSQPVAGTGVTRTRPRLSHCRQWQARTVKRATRARWPKMPAVTGDLRPSGRPAELRAHWHGRDHRHDVPSATTGTTATAATLAHGVTVAESPGAAAWAAAAPAGAAGHIAHRWADVRRWADGRLLGGVVCQCVSRFRAGGLGCAEPAAAGPAHHDAP